MVKDMKEFFIGIACKILSRCFPFVDVYAKKDKVIAITFSNSEKYIYKIAKIK